MLRNVFSTLFLVFAIQVLGTVAEVGTRTNALNTLPSSVGRGRIEVESWRSVFKRNVKAMLVPRQEAPPASPETLDLAVWERETSQRCIAQLMNLREASNPAGIAICYNVPFLDKKTGVFAADLRLYQVSKPDADWQEVGSDIGIGLTYSAAAVQEANLNPNTTESPPGAPDLVRVFYFLGLIRAEFLGDDVTDDELKRLLIPAVEVKGMKNDGSVITANLATTEASFLNGQFISDPTTSPTPSPTEPVAFALPGRYIEIMPIGLIFYSAYMVIGVCIVMFGTFERRKFRDQYRKRVAQTQPGSVRI